MDTVHSLHFGYVHGLQYFVNTVQKNRTEIEEKLNKGEEA
jgi:hypothetical protein